MFIKALCTPDTGNITLSAVTTDYTISKSTLSLLIVASDILCSYSFFIALVILKMFQLVTSNEVNKNTMTSRQFTV